MPTALVVEDNAANLRQATGVLTELGFEKIDSTITIPPALLYIEEVAERKRPPLSFWIFLSAMTADLRCCAAGKAMPV